MRLLPSSRDPKGRGDPVGSADRCSPLPRHRRTGLPRRLPLLAKTDSEVRRTLCFLVSTGPAARAWIARAEDLLGPDGPPKVLAFALWLKSRIVSTEGDQDEAMALARRAVELAEEASSTSMRALALAYEGLYRMALGDVATGRARQDHAAATHARASRGVRSRTTRRAGWVRSTAGMRSR